MIFIIINVWFELCNKSSSLVNMKLSHLLGIFHKSLLKHVHVLQYWYISCIKGPQPNWDPDIVEALDDDFDMKDPDNILDDDFMLKANAPDDGTQFNE